METKFERWLGQIAVAFIAIMVLLLVASDALPEHTEPEPSCSCAGKEDCQIATFVVGDDINDKAYCALWGDRSSCCLVYPE